MQPREDSEEFHPPRAPRFPAFDGFEIQGELGRGGMGIVYKALQVQLKRVVALKIIRSGELASPSEQARFLAEAKAVAKLLDPRIVQIFHVGEAHGLPFLVLEYVEGGSLADRLKHGPLPANEAAKLAETVARAVHVAHQRDIIHRDLKPSNVLLTTDGAPKISDFGLAKALGDPQLTASRDAVLGTARYMSPEQAWGFHRAGELGPPTDVYSLGAILYELLTGQTPFASESDLEVLARLWSEEPQPPSALRPGVPRDLETICLKCLEKEPARRYASAEGLAADLENYLRGKPIEARPVGRAERVLKWARRHPAVAALSSGLATTIVASFVGLLIFLQVVRHGNQDLAKANMTERAATKRAESAQEEAERGLYRARMNLASVALIENDGAKARTLLSAQFPRPGQQDFRRWEWYVQWRLLHQERRVLQTPGTGRAAPTLAFSPKGRTLATGCRDGSVLVWNLDKEERLTLVDQTHVASESSLTLDGKALELIHPTAVVPEVAFSPDAETLVSTGNDGRINVWNMKTNGPPNRITGPKRLYIALAYSPDGTYLATAGADGTVRLWDVAKQQELAIHLEQRNTIVPSVAFSPSSRFVAFCGIDGSVQLVDLQNGRLLQIDLKVLATSIAFFPNGKWLAVANGISGLRLFDEELREAFSWGTTDVVSSVSVARSGRLIAIGKSPAGVTVFAVSANASGRPILGASKDLWLQGGIASLAFSADDKELATIDVEGRLTLWRTDELEPLHLSGHATKGAPYDGKSPLDSVDQLLTDQAVITVAYSSDHKILASASKGSIILRDETGNVRTHQPHAGRTMSMALSPDGKLLATGNEHGVILLARTTDGKTLHLLAELGVPYTSLAFSPDGATLALGSEGETGSVTLWDPNLGTKLPPLPNCSFDTAALAFSADGRNVVGLGKRGVIRIWDIAARKETAVLLDPTVEFARVAMTPDGRTLFAGTEDGTIQAWDLATRQCFAAARAHAGRTSGMAVSGDGSTLVTSGDRRLRFWDTATLQEQASIQCSHSILCLAFSPDGRTLCGGGGDGIVRLWRKCTDQEVYEGCRRRAEQIPTDVAVLEDFTLACWSRYLDVLRGESAPRAGAVRVLQEGLDLLDRTKDAASWGDRAYWTRTFEATIDEAKRQRL